MSDHMSKLDERLAHIVSRHAGALAAAATNHSEPPNSCPRGDDSNEPPVCECCGCEYTMETGDEPTPFCDRCAHDVLEKQAAELVGLRATIATLTHRAEAAEQSATLWRERCNASEAKADAALATIAKAHAVIGGRDTHGADGDAACIVDTVLDVMEASRDISRAEALAIDQRDAARFLAAGWRRLARHYQSCHLAGHACLRETHRRLGEVAADRDEWKRGHAAQVQCVGWHRDAIAKWRKDRDEARRRASALHRRAQEAERLVGLAMRIGYATCWPLRSERAHYKALAERMQRLAEQAHRALKIRADEDASSLPPPDDAATKAESIAGKLASAGVLTSERLGGINGGLVVDTLRMAAAQIRAMTASMRGERQTASTETR